MSERATDPPDGSGSGPPPDPATTGSQETIRLSVPEMDCPSCAGKVENSVATLPGIVAIDPIPTTGALSVTFDSSETDAAAIRERVEKAGYTVEDDPRPSRTTYDVPDMDCPSCAGKVENALSDVEDVGEFETHPTTGKVVVSGDATGPDPAAVTSAIESAGYEVTGSDAPTADGQGQTPEGSDRGSIWWSTRAKKTWAAAVLLSVGLLFEFLLTGANATVATVLAREFVVSDLLFLAAAALGGQEILRNGYYSARNLNLDIDFLMSTAIVAAVTASVIDGPTSLYSEAATLAVLFSVAELLEGYAMDQARNSMRELMELAPEEATVLRDGDELTVLVDEVAVGEVVVVRPGEKIPVDGTVLDGDSAVDEAPITGESVPVDKGPGDEVYAGTINEAGYLEVETTTVAGEDTLSRIVELVEGAQSNRTEREQFVERFADYYTPVMVAIAVLIATVPPLALGLPWVTWFVYGITMLVLACPCAFVISTPVTVVSGITSAARNGVLIKGGNHLEAMGQVDAIALDKTGTLTKGELSVTDVVPLNGNTEAEVLQCARGLEERSEHPIAEAIVGEAAEDGISHGQITDFESLTGEGVTATLNGTPHYAGKPGLFDDLGFDLSHTHAVTDAGGDAVSREVRDLCERHNCLNLAEDTIPRLQAEGKTVVLVGRVGQRPTASRTESGDAEDELEGILAVADELRPGAPEMVARLRELGVETVMLTGDNERTARAIADQVGVDDYRAELLPEDKVDAIEEFLDEFESVAMVGDGINDAPALATATVGIAMGAAGTDTALETADVALMADDVSKLPYLYELSHEANGVIRQNVGASLAVKALLAIGVPLGYVGVAAAVLVGDAGMTVGVTGNAMRLARIVPHDFGSDESDDAPPEPATTEA